MGKEYYFSFDEQILYNKKIICAFYISNIERKRGFFFIVNENDQLILYYSIISSSELVKFVREYGNKMNLDKKMTFFDIFEIPNFKKEYKDVYLQSKILDKPNYILKTIERMSKDNIYNANNQIQGLDGFSVELKLDKVEERFYAWCSADDKKYFYVLDFTNSILDELAINDEYRFEKIE